MNHSIPSHCHISKYKYFNSIIKTKKRWLSLYFSSLFIPWVGTQRVFSTYFLLHWNIIQWHTHFLAWNEQKNLILGTLKHLEWIHHVMASHCQLEMRRMQANSLNAYYLENVCSVETKFWRNDCEIPENRGYYFWYYMIRITFYIYTQSLII